MVATTVPDEVIVISIQGPKGGVGRGGEGRRVSWYTNWDARRVLSWSIFPKTIVDAYRRRATVLSSLSAAPKKLSIPTTCPNSFKPSFNPKYLKL